VAGDVTISQGVDILGARDTGSHNLSRAEGKSDFTKIDGNLSRLQALNQDWQVSLSAKGQYAWSPLLSAEEFGFGGQKFGRAYNASEITGDHGLAGSIEVLYSSLPTIEDFYLQPFVFYDIGKVWNLDAGGLNPTAASAGVGVKAQHTSGVSVTFTIAQPLTRPIANPSFNNGKSTQFLFQIGMGF
jgi:hemolysin activation/secretion protein